MANECIPFYEDGDELTGYCTAAVTGKRFVMISGDRLSGPGLVLSSTDTSGGNYRIAPATAAGRIAGVAARDAAIGDTVLFLRGPGAGILPVTAGAAITAFEEVEVGAGGTAVPLASGVAVGVAMSGAANGADAEIALY